MIFVLVLPCLREPLEAPSHLLEGLIDALHSALDGRTRYRVCGCQHRVDDEREVVAVAPASVIPVLDGDGALLRRGFLADQARASRCHVAGPPDIRESLPRRERGDRLRVPPDRVLSLDPPMSVVF